jgi:serine/threonine protein kinase
MGVVWRAEDPKLGRKVALKLLKRADAALTERLVREARSMAQVNHPNVVTVYEVGEAEDGTMFIAMELVTGQSLRDWQAKTTPSIPERVAAYISAGRGLAAAHAAGIVHRDFKPDNVLVGDDGRVRVTDFGLAAAKPGASGAITPHIGDVNLTTSGSVLGTPAYMAPEQFTGGNVDSRTDQFNFCVALYEALYGERPFDGKTFTELGDNVMFGRIRPAPATARISRALREILIRGLAVKPGDRFPTMNDLITVLGRDRARPWRRTAIVAAAFAGVLALGLVSDWALRSRLGAEINQSFALTGKQLERTVGQLRDQFDTVSQVAYRESALREVAAHHDQDDFGLGTPEDDKAELERLHNTLVSTEWVRLGTSTLAIIDYKGRLLYTSADPGHWGSDLRELSFVKPALDAGKGDSVTVLPYSDPGLLASRMLGAGGARDGLAVVFVRTLALGDKTTEGSEARALYVQVQDGKQLIDNVRLDDETELALVAPTGQATGTLSRSLVRTALASTAVTEFDDGDHTYQVQARDVRGLEGQGTIAHVVMARPLDGVLSLFPGARIVFALTAIGALVLAIAAVLRARGITHGRT